MVYIYHFLPCQLPNQKIWKIKGGYLQFSATRDWGDCFKTQCTEILPRGSICVFPSYTWHRVSPVTKGRRLSLVQWNLGEGYV